MAPSFPTATPEALRLLGATRIGLVSPYLADGRIAHQECWIFLNGLFVLHQAITIRTEISFEMAREAIGPRPQRLSFTLPNAVSPRDLGLGGDLRLLGLAFGPPLENGSF